MPSLESYTILERIEDDLFPYSNWEDLHSDLDRMREDLIHESVEHISELETGTYIGRQISAAEAQNRIVDYQEEIDALQSLDTNDKEAVLRTMHMHQKRKNAAEDFINLVDGDPNSITKQ